MPGPTFAFESSRPDPTTRARVGRLATPHGTIETPAFVAAGTQATVRSLLPEEVAALGGPAVLCSTYHLYLRPGADAIADLGGLHAFMSWSGPVFTDSGSVPVFALGSGLDLGRGWLAPALLDDDPRERRRTGPMAAAQARPARVDGDGVTFRSHVDGSTHRLTPERSVAVQEQLGGDVIQALDEPALPDHDEASVARALDRTRRWAERSLAAKRRPDQALYGVVRLGRFRPLRERSAEIVGGLPFDGVAIGVSPDLPRRDLDRALAQTVPALPADRPRHLSGVGEPADLFRCVERGIDTFDSALPTRQARRGVLLTADGPLAITRLAYREDDGPVDPACACPTCRTFSRAYLRHLFVADELLAYTLAATHNLAFVFGLMARIRAALAAGRLAALRDEVLGRYRARPASAG